MLRTGIFGGSFNPIHNGHIALALRLKEQAQLDEVWLMVSPLNPLKQGSTELLSDEARLEMARAALQDEAGILASDYEMHLPRPSYTWHTLQALSRDYPDREFVLMIGGDNWAHFDRWYHAEDILNNYRIVVYPRDNRTRHTEGLTASGVTVIEAELLDISSTGIRQRVRDGRSIHGLVPHAVEEIILKNNYYA